MCAHLNITVYPILLTWVTSIQVIFKLLIPFYIAQCTCTGFQSILRFVFNIWIKNHRHFATMILPLEAVCTQDALGQLCPTRLIYLANFCLKSQRYENLVKIYKYLILNKKRYGQCGEDLMRNGGSILIYRLYFKQF